MTGGADKPKRIESAKLDWDANAPRSLFFDDIYFSGDGLEETRHVFIAGNQLAERFADAGVFAVGELGFGTGLNILAAWDLWRRTAKKRGARLRLFSTEAFPLSVSNLERAHAAQPELGEMAARLRAALPPVAPGLHRIELDEEVTLTLAYGDALYALERAEGGVDAWFFDGFAPDRNPEMWRPEIFEAAARLSNPECTFATFTVAGAVRRAIKAAGFEWRKTPGFGRKREMLCGRIEKAPRLSRRAPWFQSANAARFGPGAEIAVIGGGIAGASLAREAARAGMKATIFDPKGLAAAASGNPAGLIMPRLDLGGGPASRFSIAAYLHAIRLLNDLDDEIFSPCGVEYIAAKPDDDARFSRIADEALLPVGWIDRTDRGLMFPQSGVANPPALVAALAKDAILVQAAVARIERDIRPIVRLRDGTARAFDAIVIANGVDALQFADARGLPLSPVAGQIDYFPAAAAPAHAVAFGPYAAPAPGGGLVIGATYDKAAIAVTSAASTEENLAAVGAAAPDVVARLKSDAAHPRAAIRCQTPDRLPIVGALPDLGFYSGSYDGLRAGGAGPFPPGESIPGVYILAGLGSRGLVTAPLCAAMILAQMTGEPAPADHEIAQALHPARFFIRDLKRARRVRK